MTEEPNSKWYTPENYPDEKLEGFSKKDWVEQFILRFFICENTESPCMRATQAVCADLIKSQGIVKIEDVINLRGSCSPESIQRLDMSCLSFYFPQTYALIRAYLAYYHGGADVVETIRGISPEEISLIRQHHENITEFQGDLSDDYTERRCEEEITGHPKPETLDIKNLSLKHTLQYALRAEDEEKSCIEKMVEPYLTDNNRLLVSIDLNASLSKILNSIKACYEKRRVPSASPKPTTFAQYKFLQCLDVFILGTDKSDAAHRSVRHVMYGSNVTDSRQDYKSIKGWLGTVRNFESLLNYIKNTQHI